MLPNFDANKTAGTIGGQNYNAAGDFIGVPASQQYTVAKAASQAALSPSVQQSQTDWAALLKQIRASQAPVAPKLDYASINAQARANAENAVNPYYTKSLNDFLAGQAAQKAQTEQQTQTNIQNIQDQLAQTQKQNAVTGGRAAEDAATNTANINTQADQFQTDSGAQYDAKRLSDAKAAAAAGVTGGLGAQQQEAAQIANNTVETRAGAQTDQQKAQVELAKARTFEDLANSGAQAATSAEKGTKQANVDLANFIENQGIALTNKQNDLSTSKAAAIQSAQQNEQHVLVQNFINSIANPASRQAAISAYGSL